MKPHKKQGDKNRRARINRKVRFDYQLLDEYEAGIVLSGAEVKAARAGHIHLEGAFARIAGGEVWLHNATIGNASQARKLLMHRREIVQLASKTAGSNLTIVSTKLFFSRGWAKIKLALARRKTNFDKRRSITQREQERQIDKELRTKS